MQPVQEHIINCHTHSKQADIKPRLDWGPGFVPHVHCRVFGQGSRDNFVTPICGRQAGRNIVPLDAFVLHLPSFFIKFVQ